MVCEMAAILSRGRWVKANAQGVELTYDLTDEFHNKSTEPEQYLIVLPHKSCILTHWPLGDFLKISEK